MPLNDFWSIRSACHCEPIRIAVEKLDRNALRSPQETDANTGANGRRLACEFDALSFELGGDRIDAAYRKTEMIQAPIRGDRRGVDALAGGDRSDKDIAAAKLEVDTRFALLHAANHFGAEHRLEPLRHCLGIGGAQIDRKS